MNIKPILLTLTLAAAVFVSPAIEACTIFVLTDTNRTLFCNNEDWSSPRTRIWFVPATGKRFGCAYVGFDNGWAQGGLNSKGLAFDWVAGFKEKWQPPPELRPVPGNPSERMLETCATIEEAIAFYRTYREPSFSYAKMLLADPTGNSVMIGATNGQLQVEQARRCRGFGFGRRTLEERLATTPEPSVANAAAILRACLQQGQYATKYSCVYDLRGGDIFLFRFPDQPEAVKLNLIAELEKGAHFYDMPHIREQLAEPPRPLPESMKRMFLSEARPVSDPEPELAKHLQAMLREASEGKSRPEDYTPELRQALSAEQKKIQADLKSLGDLHSMFLVSRWNEQDQRHYRYQANFGNATLLQHYVLDEHGKVARVQTEDIEWKSVSTDSSVALETPPRLDNRQVTTFTEAERKAPQRRMFFPHPLNDDWSKWIVGEWEGAGESDTGQGKGIEQIEFALSGQFLICRGEAKITEITPDHAAYLKRNLHASDEEIERFKREGYQSLQLFTIDQTTGEVVGYLFDSLRCIATGRGKREGDREIMEWQWATGHKSTRITERLGEDRMRVIQRTPMPDGSVMEEKSESVRKKPRR